jgi:hypothetical protein
MVVVRGDRKLVFHPLIGLSLDQLCIASGEYVILVERPHNPAYLWDLALHTVHVLPEGNAYSPPAVRVAATGVMDPKSMMRACVVLDRIRSPQERGIEDPVELADLMQDVGAMSASSTVPLANQTGAIKLVASLHSLIDQCDLDLRQSSNIGRQEQAATRRMRDLLMAIRKRLQSDCDHSQWTDIDISLASVEAGRSAGLNMDDQFITAPPPPQPTPSALSEMFEPRDLRRAATIRAAEAAAASCATAVALGQGYRGSAPMPPPSSELSTADEDLQYFRIACSRLLKLGERVRREEDELDRDVELAMALSLSDHAQPSTLVQADEDTVALHRAIELSLSSTDWYPDDPDDSQ